MAKKKFSEGLDNVFRQQEKDEDKFVLASPYKAEKLLDDDKYELPVAKQQHSKKNFTSDLESLFQEALEESVSEHIQKAKKGVDLTKERTKPFSRVKHTLSGIDALIRQTVEDSKIEFKRGQGQQTGRITFTLDPQKLNKLKSIARVQKAYIKDIIDQLVSEYISEQERHGFSVGE